MSAYVTYGMGGVNIIQLSDNKKAVVIFNLILIIFFYKTIFLGEEFIPSNLMYEVPPWNSIGNVKTTGELLSDPIDVFLPDYHFIKENVIRGQLPLWNPHIAMGEPFYLKLITFLMYPLNWLFLLLPLEWANFFHGYLRLFLALYGMYLFLGRINLGLPSRMFGAIVFAFSGPMVVWFNWPHTYVASLAPLLFYFIDKAVIEKHLKSLTMAVLTLVFMFYAGMPTYTAYFLYLLGFYIIFRILSFSPYSLNKYLKQITIFSTIVVLGGGISFAYTGSLLHQMEQLGYLMQRTEHYSITLSSIFFNEFIFPRSSTASMHFNEFAMYVGVMPLILVIGSILFVKKDKNTVFWLLVCIVLLLIIFTHSLDVIIKYLPFINTSLKIRVLILLVFSISVLSAISLNIFICRDQRVKHWFLIIGYILALYIYVLQFNETSEFLKILTIFLLFGLLASYIYKKNTKLLSSALILILVIDLVAFGINYNPTVTKEAEAIPITSSIEYLQEKNSYDRFVALGKWTLFPNTSMFYKLNDLRGHTLIVTSPLLSNFVKQIHSQSYTTATRTELDSIENITFFNLTGTKYILSPNDLDDKLLESNLSIHNDKVPLGEITGEVTVKQSFLAKHNGLSSIEVLLATYKRSFQDKPPDIEFSIIDKSSNSLVEEVTVGASHINDNQYFTIEFEPINNSEGRTFELVISSPNSEPGNAITAWVSVEKLYYNGSLFVNNHILEGDLFINIGYTKKNENFSFVNEFDDGLFLYENRKALPRAYIASSIIDVSSLKLDNNLYPDEVLALLNNAENPKDIIIEDLQGYAITNNRKSVDEYAKIISYSPNRIHVEANLNEPGFLVITDNYYPGWVVQVNGETAEILRANTIFRAVKLEKGTHLVEFDFKPVVFCRNIFVSLVFSGMFILYVIFRCRREKLNSYK